MTLFDIVGFVLSRYFQWYQWCSNWRFSVSMLSLSLFFFPLFSFLSSHVRPISLFFFEMLQFWIATSLKVTFSNRGKYKLCVNSFYSVILPVLKKIANFQRKKILKIVSEEMHLTFYDHITQFRCCLFWNPTVLLKKFEFFNLI
jgi:hypothetical protein